jgi:hypothetical protein
MSTDEIKDLTAQVAAVLLANQELSDKLKKEQQIASDRIHALETEIKTSMSNSQTSTTVLPSNGARTIDRHFDTCVKMEFTGTKLTGLENQDQFHRDYKNYAFLWGFAIDYFSEISVNSLLSKRFDNTGAKLEKDSQLFLTHLNSECSNRLVTIELRVLLLSKLRKLIPVPVGKRINLSCGHGDIVYGWKLVMDAFRTHTFESEAAALGKYWTHSWKGGVKLEDFIMTCEDMANKINAFKRKGVEITPEISNLMLLFRAKKHNNEYKMQVQMIENEMQKDPKYDLDLIKDNLVSYAKNNETMHSSLNAFNDAGSQHICFSWRG